MFHWYVGADQRKDPFLVGVVFATTGQIPVGGWAGPLGCTLAWSARSPGAFCCGTGSRDRSHTQPTGLPRWCRRWPPRWWGFFRRVPSPPRSCAARSRRRCGPLSIKGVVWVLFGFVTYMSFNSLTSMASLSLIEISMRIRDSSFFSSREWASSLAPRPTSPVMEL